MLGHGGLFKTKGVMQRYLAAAVNAPVTVMDTATEGGAWGIALLAAYLVDGKNSESLETYLEQRVFARQTGFTIAPDHKDVEGLETFMRRYKAGIAVERTAVETIRW